MKTSEFLQFSLSLGLIVGLATAGLSKVYLKTQGAIARQQEKKLTDALGLVLPQASSFAVVRVPEPVDSYWVGSNKRGDLVGAAFKVSGRGYSGDLVSLVGVDTAGRILRMRILKQSETPGFGSRVEERVFGATLWSPSRKTAEGEIPWFQEQFSGLAVDREIGVRHGQEWPRLSLQKRNALRSDNAISALTGATITSWAVINSLPETAGYVLEHFRTLAAKAADTTKAEENHAPVAR